MKTTRKILALLMALTLCLALAAPAFAQSTPSYTITIDNAVEGETYTAYKIFNVSYTNDASPVTTPEPENDIPGDPDPNSAHTAYAYTILDTSPWWDVVTLSGAVPQSPTLGSNFTANGLKFTKTANTNEWIVEEASGFNAATFAEVLRNNMPRDPAAAATVTADAGDNEADPPVLGNMTGVVAHNGYKTGSITLNVSSAGAGYYFVDTSMGSLCSLDTTEPSATIREKNSLPALVKTVSNDLEGTYTSSVSEFTSDDVFFRIEVTDGIGTDAALTVHDVMSAGLSFNHDPIIEVNTGAGGAFDPVADTNYTIKCNDETHSSEAPVHQECTFEIVFNADFMASLDETNVIRITYSAVVETDAVIAELGNPNSAYLTYSNQTSPESTAIVYTYAGAIYKVDGTATSGAAPELAGARFAVTIETPANGDDPAVSTPVYLTQVDPGSATTPAIYVNDDYEGSNIIETPESGAVVLLGFKDQTVLTLTEIAAPTGYNLLSAPVTLTINATNADTANKSATVTGGATATFVASRFESEQANEGEGHSHSTQIVYVMGDDAGKQIHANSINIIENLTGSELPSTGGIGTTIFIIAGSVLVLGAGIILVAMSVSKRRSEEN